LLEAGFWYNTTRFLCPKKEDFMFLDEQEYRRSENLIQVDVKQEVPWKERQWILTINPLAVEGSIASKLGFDDYLLASNSIMLDWSNILSRPNQARMHVFVGAEKRVPFEVKLERMQTWAGAIEIYDSLMVDGITKLSKGEAERMLRNCQFPRLDTVVLDVGPEGLRKLLRNFGFKASKEKPHPFELKWQELVTLAKSGEFVGQWRALKGK